jgi:hypothetical protein
VRNTNTRPAFKVAGISETYPEVGKKLYLAFLEMTNVETGQQLTDLRVPQNLPVKPVNNRFGGLAVQNLLVQQAHIVTTEAIKSDQRQLRVTPVGIKTELVTEGRSRFSGWHQ